MGTSPSDMEYEMKFLLAVCMILLAGCATSHAEVDAIQKSCDDPQSSSTVINGHSYFCDDSAHCEMFIDAISKQLQGRHI
jgi:hypothetical protein